MYKPGEAANCSSDDGARSQLTRGLMKQSKSDNIQPDTVRSTWVQRERPHVFPITAP
jgi:hypothetical protein